jgi:hypothetical protein
VLASVVLLNFPVGRDAATMIAAFPVAAESRQRIAQASLEKAPKIVLCTGWPGFSDWRLLYCEGLD